MRQIFIANNSYNCFCDALLPTMSDILSIAALQLGALGARLREARIARGDSQTVFAERIGVSAATLRAMENGEPSTAVGHWLAAFWVLDRLPEIDGLLVQESLFGNHAGRRRVSRKRDGRP